MFEQICNSIVESTGGCRIAPGQFIASMKGSKLLRNLNTCVLKHGLYPKDWHKSQFLLIWQGDSIELEADLETGHIRLEVFKDKPLQLAA